MKTSDINEFKAHVKNALLDWTENKIDALFPNKPQVRAIIKNGLNNFIVRIDNKVNNYIDNIVLFIADEKGNIDSDSMVDMGIRMFDEMEQGNYSLGFVDMRIGKGEIIIDLPQNIFLDMLVGNHGSVRFTSEDIKEFKNYFN